MNRDALYTTESLSEDLERDFLKQNDMVDSFYGGNGLWLVSIRGNFYSFKDELDKYAKTRVYMHFENVKLVNSERNQVLINLLGLH